MTFNRSANPTVAAMKLHGALDLERGRVCGVPGNPDKDKPLLIRESAEISNLSASENCATVEDLGRQ